jgi:hypothetical protein
MRESGIAMLARNPRYYGGGYRRFDRGPQNTLLLLALAVDFGVLLAIAGVAWPMFIALASFLVAAAPAAWRRERHSWRP